MKKSNEKAGLQVSAREPKLAETCKAAHSLDLIM